ncbi:unnamed protein product [Pleuronectes platessa]|uniref:Uncharacterized protein n=1 Tax=Pleuronectes platessa TaxID=8262 RepID=A0A9N7VSI1_PLEPL|nr:unnamed protein product [Pleuronectes platessa]
MCLISRRLGYLVQQCPSFVSHWVISPLAAMWSLMSLSQGLYPLEAPFEDRLRHSGTTTLSHFEYGQKKHPFIQRKLSPPWLDPSLHQPIPGFIVWKNLNVSNLSTLWTQLLVTLQT